MIDKVKTLLATGTQFVQKWYFLTSAVVLAILVYLLDSKEKTIKQLNEEILSLKIAKELQLLKEKAEKDDLSYQEASKQYFDFKSTHADLFRKLGISVPLYTVSAKPDTRGNPTSN